MESVGEGKVPVQFVPANLAWKNGHWNPVESSGVHMDYVGEGKDLLPSYFPYPSCRL